MPKLALISLVSICGCTAVHPLDECQIADGHSENRSLLQSLQKPIPKATSVSASSKSAAQQGADTSAFRQGHGNANPGFWQFSSGGDMMRRTLIPPQIVMTGNLSSLQDLPAEAMENVQNTLALAPSMSVRYLDDKACQLFLDQHIGDMEMIGFFEKERHGSFRGDICRAAVLYKEGGFYIDLDFALRAPLLNFIDDNTTFMAGLQARTTHDSFIWNALLAVAPNSPIMQESMIRILKWYEVPHDDGSLLGPESLSQAVSFYMNQNCPDVPLPYKDTANGRVHCGIENMRFLQEMRLGYGEECAQLGNVICPSERETSEFDGHHYGVFDIGEEDIEKRFVGWSRYLKCSTLGCKINGGEASFSRKAQTKAKRGRIFSQRKAQTKAAH